MANAPSHLEKDVSFSGLLYTANGQGRGKSFNENLWHIIAIAAAAAAAAVAGNSQFSHREAFLGHISLSHLPLDEDDRVIWGRLSDAIPHFHG